MADPGLDEAERTDLVYRLMAARRAVRDAKRNADLKAEAAAHRAVDEVKRALGERGPVWWVAGSQPAHDQEHALCRLACEDRAFPPGRNLNAESCYL
jgi:hypothetical protein